MYMCVLVWQFVCESIGGNLNKKSIHQKDVNGAEVLKKYLAANKCEFQLTELPSISGTFHLLFHLFDKSSAPPHVIPNPYAYP